MERDQVVARDFLGLAPPSAAPAAGSDGSRRSVREEGKVTRPSVISSFHDAGDGGSGTRLRQMTESAGLHLASAFTSNGRQVRGGGHNLLKATPHAVVHAAAPEYQAGQWTGVEKAREQSMSQTHPNFGFERRDLKERGSHEPQAQLVLGASRAQFAAANRRFAVPPPALNSRPPDERRTAVHDSNLSLSMSGPREHALPVPNFRVPPTTAALGASTSATFPTASLAMGAPRPPLNFASNGTVVSRPTTSSSSGKPLAAQLTIFYAGSVNVYDDVPADKAQAIMLLAGSGSSWSTSIVAAPAPSSSPAAGVMAGSQFSRPDAPVSSPSAPLLTQQQHAVSKWQPTASPLTTQTSGASSTSNQQDASNSSLTQAQNLHRGQAFDELPQARKHSLARFLEKRKERATVRQKAVYPDRKDGSPPRPKSPCSPPVSGAASAGPSYASASISALSNQAEGSEGQHYKVKSEEQGRAEQEGHVAHNRKEEGQSSRTSL